MIILLPQKEALNRTTVKLKRLTVHRIKDLGNTNGKT